MKVHLFSGWAFPSTALHPIADQLGIPVAFDPAAAAIWIGWSLGGLRALALRSELLARGIAHPSALVLLASTARFCGDEAHWPGQPTGQLRVLERQLTRAPDAALHRFHALCAGLAATPATLDARRRASLQLDRQDLLQGLHALAELDLREALAAWNIPVLILHGAEDRVIPPEAARAMADRLPDARLFVHPTAGHDLPLAQTAWVVGHIQDFLRECGWRSVQAGKAHRRGDDVERNGV